MTSWILLATGVFAVGCGARVGDSPGARDDHADAANSGGSDAGSDGNIDAAVQGGIDGAPSACPNNRKVFLAFEGVTIAKAATSDAVNNQASWIGANATVPKWRPNSGNRANEIATVVAGVKSRLAQTPIEVVTTRPPAGPYVMVVFGGQNTGNGGNVSTPYGGSTNEHDCGDLVKSDVAWVSEGVSTSYAQDLAVGAIGWGLGLNGTNDPNDCMCSWANNCNSASGACSLHDNIATTQSASPATTCPNQNPQNEIAAFTTQFCQ